ncbi:MAG: chemotaxis protein CheW [Rubrivivax sp.]|jgi:twitching motility protein PilI|nr:chemotaxis protein CheW [Rubrivivax sp.]
MANREALRELQARLAERLQGARNDTRQAGWLALEAAGASLLVSLPSAGEIFPLSPLLPVPHTQPWFLGVANLRGGLHGVVDLGAFLGLRPPMARDAHREHARLLALNPSLGAHCAVLVDRLSGLRGVHQLERDTAVADGPRPRFAGTTWRDAAGRAWQEIDLAALARHEQFLGIAA